ncbi:6-phosphofructokinase [Sinomicrobium sp. M5D2P17]
MKKIAILTSGGDVPGLNACIRAIVKAASYHNISILGIKGGFEGMITGDFIPLDPLEINHIIHLGGTILKSSRSARFKTEEGRKIAYHQLRKEGIDALILIGGDGSLKGGLIFCEEYKDIPIMGIPKTIDNDISGTDYCIGYDTALNTAMQAIDKIRDTAESHDRIFIVEVMGRDAGYIAYGTGVASGADGILIPETTADLEYLQRSFAKDRNIKKTSLIIVVAEGDESGGAITIAEKVKKHAAGRDIRISVLGHIQRGGSPTAFDRILAARLGVAAVETLLKGAKNSMVGIIKNDLFTTPLADIKNRNMNIDKDALKFLEILTT